MNQPWSDVSKLELEVEALRKERDELELALECVSGAYQVSDLIKERDELLKTKKLWDEYRFENWSAHIEVQKQYIEQIQAERDAYREALENISVQCSKAGLSVLQTDFLLFVPKVLAKYKTK